MGASNRKQQNTESSNEESSCNDTESNHEEELVSNSYNSRDGSHLDSRMNHHPSYSDHEILRARYIILNKWRRDSKPLRCKEAFNKPPYNSERHFCRGLVTELLKSTTTDIATTNDIITQEQFTREIVKWQDMDEIGKLSLMFTCMLNTAMADGTSSLPTVLTHHILWRVLHHSLDNSMYSETECKQLAKRMIDAMADNQEDDESSQRRATEQEVTLSQYKKWFTRNTMKEKLKESLELKISNLN